jgi:hypothetical protein
VVGVFPAFLELVGIGDLGSAGHNGFRDNEGRRFSVTYLRGGHAAAIRDQIFPSMVLFLMEGKVLAIPRSLDAREQKLVAVIASRLNWLVLMALLATTLLIVMSPVLIATNWWAAMASAGPRLVLLVIIC